MYTDTELMNILDNVAKEFSTHLAKAEDKPFPPKDEKKPEEESKDKPEEKKPAEGESKEEPGKEQPQAAEGEQPAAAPGEVPAEAQPEVPAEGQPQMPQGDESHGYDDEDMQHMQKMYMSMSKAELKAHHDACRAALDSQGMQKCGDMGMQKSETETSIEVKVPEISVETTLLKSELDAEKARTADLQKKVDLATEFMAKLAAKKSAPQGKAITSIEVIAKSEKIDSEKTYTVSEVTSILAKKSEDPSLSKSDREAINDYYLGSKKDIQIVRHLLA